jgi:hypothetical protein
MSTRINKVARAVLWATILLAAGAMLFAGAQAQHTRRVLDSWDMKAVVDTPPAYDAEHPLADIAGDTLVMGIQALTECFASYMGIADDWEIFTEFVDATDEDWVARIDVESSYYQAYIQYDTTWLRQQTVEYIRGTVVHELFHIEVDDLATLAQRANMSRGLKFEEQLSTRVERWHVWDWVCVSDGRGSIR